MRNVSESFTERIRIHDLYYNKLDCLPHEDRTDRFSEMSVTNYPLTPKKSQKCERLLLLNLLAHIVTAAFTGV